MNNYLLHLETSTKVCSVAISKEGRIIALKESNADTFIHSESLTLYITEALSIAEIELQQLSAISISSGPGSYTGLRIGLSTAKGLCFALKIPLIAIDSLEALKSLVTSQDYFIIPMIDARRMEVYCQVYDPNGRQVKALDACLLDEHSFLDFEPFIALGDGAEKCREIWKNRQILWRTDLLSSAKGQCTIAHEKFVNKEFVDLAYFSPIYLKDANGIRP